jgi:hypothetical protein
MQSSAICHKKYSPESNNSEAGELSTHEKISTIHFRTIIKGLLALMAIICASITNVYSQDYDLIVNIKNDSIACHIDSISENTIYFEMRYKKNWIHTQYDKSQVIDYKLNTVNKKDVSFKRGTSIIINPDSLKINQIKRNILYGNGSFSVSHYTYTLNYERILSISQNAKKTWSFRLGYGIIDTEGKILLATFNNLRGKGRNKFEMNIGATYINEPHSYGPHYVTVVLNAGYRRQSPDKRFVLRAGIGTPEGPYLSLGYSF